MHVLRLKDGRDLLREYARLFRSIGLQVSEGKLKRHHDRVIPDSRSDEDVSSLSEIHLRVSEISTSEGNTTADPRVSDLEEQLIKHSVSALVSINDRKRLLRATDVYHVVGEVSPGGQVQHVVVIWPQNLQYSVADCERLPGLAFLEMDCGKLHENFCDLCLFSDTAVEKERPL